jgi:hypothetical protein
LGAFREVIALAWGCGNCLQGGVSEARRVWAPTLTLRACQFWEEVNTACGGPEKAGYAKAGGPPVTLLPLIQQPNKFRVPRRGKRAEPERAHIG